MYPQIKVSATHSAVQPKSRQVTMMYPKPKSAPGRFMQSKFVKNRTNAMKEIEAWVKKDDERSGTAHEASRMSGQLTDNVTEERMLRAKLWELSKERYKVGRVGMRGRYVFL